LKIIQCSKEKLTSSIPVEFNLIQTSLQLIFLTYKLILIIYKNSKNHYQFNNFNHYSNQNNNKNNLFNKLINKNYLKKYMNTRNNMN
jgi:hypothetical protein